MFKWLKDLFSWGEKDDLNKDEPLTNEEAYSLIVDGRKKYKLNCVKVPERVKTKSLAALAASPRFTAPKTVDLRDYCTQTENQGNLPYCAAYTAVGFAENVMWRRDDYITQIDPVAIYKRAKEIDGDPGEGTSLTAVLDVLLEKKYFDPNLCKIQVIYDTIGFEQSIKYAIHKFGCLLLACDITEEWYLCGPKKTAITGKNNNRSVGGMLYSAAVIIVTVLLSITLGVRNGVLMVMPSLPGKHSGNSSCMLLSLPTVLTI